MEPKKPIDERELIAASSGVAQAILQNLLTAHSNICINATRHDVIQLKQLTRMILRLADQIGDELIYLVPKEDSSRGAKPPKNLEDSN